MSDEGAEITSNEGKMEMLRGAVYTALVLLAFISTAAFACEGQVGQVGQVVCEDAFLRTIAEHGTLRRMQRR